MSQSREFVPVVHARDVLEAEFFKALLLAEDIPAIIEDENSETLGMPMSILSQGVPVLVPDDMKGQAEQVLREHRQPAVDPDELDRQAMQADPNDDAAPPEEP